MWAALRIARCAVGVCLLALAGSACALIQPGVGPGVTTIPGGSGVTISGATSGGGSWIGRTFAAGSSAGSPGVSIVDKLKIPLGAGSPEVSVSRVAAGAAVVTAAVAVGAAAWGGCAAGTAIAKYAGLGDSSTNGSRTGCNLTDWVIDYGQAPQLVARYQPQTVSGQLIGGPVYGTQEAACQSTQVHAWINSGYAGTYHTYVGGCAYKVYNNQTGQFITDVYFSAPAAGSGVTCPATVDALDPAYSTPAGAPVGPDGKCASGRYNAVSAAEAQARLQQYGKPAELPALARETLAKGQPIAEADPLAITGVSPQTVSGRPTTKTTTKSDGTVSTETRTPVTTYQHQGNTLTYSTVYNSTTNTCVGVGSCSTDTSTEEVPAETEDKTDCERNPSAAGCAELGTPTEAEGMPRQSVPIAWTPVDVGGQGSCPEDSTFAVGSLQYIMPMAPVCDAVVRYVRPLVVIMGGILASFVFVGGFKT